VAIFTVAKRLEPPTLAEGFDQLFYVELAADRSVRVREVQDDTQA
ncbi:MAG: ATP-binding protein, partial [Acidobacteria bacterium]|nr:ATP-binding protein [Acidobacteriota bacterium]